MPKTPPQPRCPACRGPGHRPTPGYPDPGNGVCDRCLAGPVPDPGADALPPGRRTLAERWMWLSDKEVARRYGWMPDADQDDRRQDGYAAVVNAAWHWDGNFGVQFNTYAVTAIQRDFGKLWAKLSRRLGVVVPMDPEMDDPPARGEWDPERGRAEAAAALARIDTATATGKRRRLAVELYYGVGDEPCGPLTLEELGAVLGTLEWREGARVRRKGVTKEAARLILRAAVREMRQAVGVAS